MPGVDTSNNITINIPGSGNVSDLVVNSTGSTIEMDASNNTVS